MKVDFRSQERWPVGLRIRLMGCLWRLWRKDKLVLGRAVEHFERALAEYVGGHRIAVTVGSGTDAIYLSLSALGIGPGSETIAPANVCVAVVESVLRTGATLRFVDIRPDTYTMDPAEVSKAINSRTQALLPVHTYGLPADIDEIGTLARENGLKIVELCGQAFGATFHGYPVGSFGDAACFSFNPSKILSGGGDGGAVLTPFPDLAERIRRIRDHGRLFIGDDAEFPGISSRLDTLNARILLERLRYITKELTRRRDMATYYRSLLPARIKRQSEPAQRNSVYQFLVVETDNREQIRSALKKRGIETKVHYRLPYKMPGYQGSTLLKGMESLKITEEVGNRIMTLPFYTYFRKQDAEYVCQTLTEVQDSRVDGP